jgi:hypothetical protein
MAYYATAVAQYNVASMPVLGQCCGIMRMDKQQRGIAMPPAAITKKPPISPYLWMF